MQTWEILVWVLDLAFLARILWQGEIIIKNDRERLELERQNFAMNHDRAEERTKWRQAKQKLQLKNLENAVKDSGVTTAGPTTCTTNSSESKVENAPVVADPPN